MNGFVIFVKKTSINLATQNIIAILDLSLNLMQKEMMNHSISSVLSSGIQSISNQRSLR